MSQTECNTCDGLGQIVVGGPYCQGPFQPPEYETEVCDMCGGSGIAKPNTVTIPLELAERLARPNPDLHGWVTFNTADMILAAKELRELMDKEGV